MITDPSPLKTLPIPTGDLDVSMEEQYSTEEETFGEISLKDEEKKKGTSGAVVAITIPSIEYPDQYKAYLPLWRQEFKEEGLVHCPNYEVCSFNSTASDNLTCGLQVLLYNSSLPQTKMPSSP